MLIIKVKQVLNLVIKNNFKNIYDLLTLRVNELNNQFNKTNIYIRTRTKNLLLQRKQIFTK